MKTISSTAPAVMAMALTALALASPVQATLLSYSRTFLNTDYASAGYGGMRGGDGTGTITLSGVSGTVKQALLYWHGPQNEANGNASVLFANQAINGVSLGRSSDNIWGFAHAEAYRADVTAFVTGSGLYSLANFIKTGAGNTLSADINGVSLLVSYDDGNDTNNRDIMLFEGNDSNLGEGTDADGWQASLGSFNYSSGDVVLELGVSDGQAADDAALEVNGQELVASGPIFSGTSVPVGPTAIDTDGGLWDIRRFEIDSLLSPGINTLELTSFVELDYLSLVHAVVNLPTGTSPVPPPVQVPDGGGTLGLLALSMLMLRRFFGEKPAV
jgi:hypothetical protein